MNGKAKKPSSKSSVFKAKIQHPSEPQVNRSLGSAIRAIRLEKGLTQQTVADNAGVHRNFVGNVESGKQSISLYHLVRVAGSIGSSLVDILARAEIK